LYGATIGSWPYIYLCDDEKCQSYVGCHEGTDEPFGTMADERTRKARQLAHEVFDAVWKSGKMKRRVAYEWLAKELNLSYAKCHIGMFNVKQCERTINIVFRSGVMRNS
jgi:hypothetical protein